MTNGNTRTLLIKGNGMEADYAMDDDPHSPTDSSEDSVEVRVEAITNRHKRKLSEPRRFNSGPLKKRLCARSSDHSSQPFRPWNEKETNNNNNTEVRDGDGENKRKEVEGEVFYKATGERINKISGRDGLVKEEIRRNEIVEEERSSACSPKIQEESIYYHPRLINEDSLRINENIPSRINENASTKRIGDASLRRSEETPDITLRGNETKEFVVSEEAKNVISEETKILGFKEENPLYFTDESKTPTIKRRLEEGGYFQPPVVPRDGSMEAAIFKGNLKEETLEDETEFRKRLEGEELLYKNALNEERTRGAPYFQPPSIPRMSPAEEQPYFKKEKNTAPLDLAKTQIKTEPRIPSHPHPEDSIEHSEEMINTTMLSFPKLTHVNEEKANPEAKKFGNYKNLIEQNQQRNYKNMTRERRIEANARERTRVHTISAAFETLRKSVPSYSDKQKLSKLSVLRIACSYITTLENLLRDDVEEDALGESVERVGGTIQREGKLRKKKDDD